MAATKENGFPQDKGVEDVAAVEEFFGKMSVSHGSSISFCEWSFEHSRNISHVIQARLEEMKSIV